MKLSLVDTDPHVTSFLPEVLLGLEVRPPLSEIPLRQLN
jgi:hypothetical protein